MTSSRTTSGKFILVSLAVLVLVFGRVVPAAAQVTSGTILGSVQDTTGAAIPGATITATAPSVGIKRIVVSSGNGTFAVPNLDGATYDLSVTAKGFETLKRSGLVLSSADKLNAGVFTLKVGAETATVTVDADSAQLQLQSNSGERSDLITGKQLNDIALNGRNVLDILRVIPGVAGYDGSIGVSGTGGLTSYSVNGTRTNAHQFTVDGASNVDTGDNGGTQVTINTDAIAEVKVLTSNYQAEFGKAGGGSIIVTSRGGTNQFHGNLHFFHRNEGMDANTWLGDHNHIAKQKYRYNTIGGQIGGPILHDRVYFFYSNEFYRQLVPGSVSTYRVPTNLERAGNFSQSVDSNGHAIQIYNPNTLTQFSNNIINPQQLTAAQQANFTQIQNILNLYPQPNVTGQSTYNRQDPLSYSHPRSEYIGRVDYQISPSERLFVRYINNRDVATGPIGSFGLECSGSLQFAGGCTDKQPGWNLSADLTSTLLSHLVNEVNVGPSVYRSDVAGVNGNITVGQNNINLPLLYPVTSTTSIPDFGFSGNGQSYPSTYFGATPWHQATTTIDANDNLTWSVHAHTLKFGAYYQRARKDQIAYGNSNGSFSFNAQCTGPFGCATGSTTYNGDPFASALVGQFSGFNQSSARPTGYFRYNQLEFYAQDTWQISPRLTLDYGMRFAYIPPQYDAKSQVALFTPSTYNPATAVAINGTTGNLITPVTGNTLDGETYAASGQIPKGGWNTAGILFEPRFGFAWDFVGDYKTVLRGGFGSSHDREQGNLIFNTVFSNPAVVVSPSFSNANITSIPTAASNTPGTLSNIVGADRSGQVPVVWSFSLGVQRQIGAGTTLDVAYVGTQGRHLVTDRNINSIPYGTAFTRAAQNPANFTGGIVPAVEPNLPPEYAAAGYSFSGRYAYQMNYLAPYKGYGQMDYYKFDGTSNYNSLQVSVQRRFTRKLTFGGAYTWAKNLTTSGADQSYVDPFNPRKYSYGEPSYERRNVAAINYVYDLPNVSKRLHAPEWMSYVTDGLQLSGLADMQGGQPVRNAIYAPANQLDGGSQYSKTPPYYVGVNHSGNLLLPTIGAPNLGAPGSLRQGAMVTWDSSIFKNFAIGEPSKGRSIQLRGEFFNVLNHPNFSSRDYNANITLPTYNSNGTYTPLSIAKDGNWGQPTGSISPVAPGGPRVIQLAAKLYF